MKAFVRIAVTLAGLVFHYPSLSQSEYPQRPAKILVGFSAGGGPDVFARVLSQKLSDLFGQPFVVENRTGAAGTIAAEAVAKSPADGYTLLVGDSATLMINAHLQSAQRFDPIRELAPVSRGVIVPMWLVIHPSVEATSVSELVRLAKRRTPPYAYASSGSGTIIHIVMENFKAQTGTDFLHIPFKGTGQSVQALLAGDVVLGFFGLPTVLPSIKAGKLKVLAISTAKRSQLTPDVPTLAEAGLSGFDMAASLSMFAPAGTPTEVVQKLNSAVGIAVTSKEVVEKLANMGMEPSVSTPQQFADALRREYAQFGRLVRQLNIRSE